MTPAENAAPRYQADRHSLPDWLRASARFFTDTFGALSPPPGAPDLTFTSLLGIPTVVVRHPDIVEEVLARGQETFVRDRLTRRTSAVFGEGLLLAEGAEWRRQRRMLTPGFQQARYACYAQVMLDRTRDAVARWRDGATIDLAAELSRLTLEIAVQSLFGAGVSAADAAEVSAAFAEISDYMASALANLPFALPDWLPLPMIRRYHAAVATLDRTVERLVRARRAAAHPAEVSETGHDDLLGMLLAARDEQGQALRDRQVRDQLVTFLLAGHETTALGLTYALFLLGHDPARRRRLVEEADAVPAGSALDPGAYPFAAQVFKEALRLYPPAYALSREAAVDLMLGGHPVRRGTLVVVSPWTLQRDERNFARPLSFEPERWTPEFERALSPGAYFPFGLGPRKCIGVRFATMEGVLVLGALARAVTLQPLEAKLPPLQPAITARPTRPVPARVQHRA